MSRPYACLTALLTTLAACPDDTSSTGGSDDGSSGSTTGTAATGAGQSSSGGDTTGREATSVASSTGAPTSAGDTESSSASSSSSGQDSGSSDSSTGGEAVWMPPDCDMVTGTGAVTFTFDEGNTLAPMDGQILPVTYTFGLVALGQPGALLAASGDQILASSDAGCSWDSVGQITGGTPVLRAAGDTRAYGFVDNGEGLTRIDDGVITALSSPVGNVVGLGVDPTDPDHVRIGDSEGQLWDSTDAGEQWSLQGVASGAGPLVYRAFFDPTNLDHAIFGVAVQGAWVTMDGGARWSQSTGFGPGNANAFTVSISSADPSVVWAEGYDLANLDDATARHVFRSEDGGLTFAPVVDADQATLYNGNHLFPHPTDPDVLYFVFGTNFQNYGTDVYRYDHGTGAVTLSHNPWHDVAAITFLPGDPSLMYFGLSIEP